MKHKPKPPVYVAKAIDIIMQNMAAAEIDKAFHDALITGTGFLKITLDGVVRIDPAEWRSERYKK